MEPSLLNYNEAAAELGIARRSVERLVEAGSLPRVRIGAAVRIRRQDLDDYVDALGGASEARSA
ncbi:MAG: helix-turn-helix domain-containing protein [Acidimicrobiia bacterium]|nr:helix-turn-helix domain-containing protein [Acidimicrobiia bacterium]